MDYLWFVKKLRKGCFLFGTYQKQFVIHDPELLKLIPVILLTDTLNWQVLWSMEKYLLKNLYEKLESKVSLKQVLTVKNLSFPKDKQIKVIYTASF